MWAQRTPEEVARWDAITRREARFHGLGIASLVWIAGSLLAAGGLIYTRAGVFQRGVVGNFWARLVMFAVVLAPFCYWIYHHERRKELAKAYRRTICPTCDIACEGNAGATCRCGTTFVSQCAMKWIDDR